MAKHLAQSEQRELNTEPGKRERAPKNVRAFGASALTDRLKNAPQNGINAAVSTHSGAALSISAAPPQIPAAKASR